MSDIAIAATLRGGTVLDRQGRRPADSPLILDRPRAPNCRGQTTPDISPRWRLTGVDQGVRQTPVDSSMEDVKPAEIAAAPAAYLFTIATRRDSRKGWQPARNTLEPMLRDERLTGMGSVGYRHQYSQQAPDARNSSAASGENAGTTVRAAPAWPPTCAAPPRYMGAPTTDI